MNKLVLSLVIVAIVAVALGTTGVAYAQGQQPPTPQNPGTAYGRGMMGGGLRGGMMGARGTASQGGFLHEEMTAAFAGKFALTVDELNARLAGGETLSEVAYALGLTAEQFQTLWAEARLQALDQAVADGKLTQAQADWMNQRGFGMVGGRGAGQGKFANPSCPYYKQTNP